MVNKSVLAGIIASKAETLPEKPPTRRSQAKALNLKLDPPDYKRLRHAAYVTEKKMRAIIMEGLDLWFEKNMPK